MDNYLNTYAEFLKNKMIVAESSGFEVSADAIHPTAFKFQRDIIRWALHLGRAAIFANVGLGKTIMQVEWSKHVAAHTGGRILILAPLAVTDQTIREAQDKLGVSIKYVETPSDIDATDIIVTTNYERADRFADMEFAGIVLDESSILKHYSTTFFALCKQFERTPYRLCCTATPSPNDIVEIGNHSTFLGIMDFHDVLARWFVGEGDVAREARLKHHAVEDFYRWLTSWAVCITKPSDLGPEYAMPGYDLPVAEIHEYRLGMSDETIQRTFAEGKLIPGTPSATSFQKVKRESLADRVEQVKQLVTDIDSGDPIIIWCDTDYEADRLKEVLPEAIEVRGSYTPKTKTDRLRAFTAGEARIIITKAEIAGFGLNWQHCNQMIFAGVSFSFERTYQAMGRIVRYGQKRTPHIHLICSSAEDSVRQALASKQKAFIEMQGEMSKAMRQYGLFRAGTNTTTFSETQEDTASGRLWTMHLGDCVPITRSMPENSINFSVHSPPFASLYTYSDKQADMGNAASDKEFFEHYEFLIRELLRVTAPGRCAAVHVKDLPLFVNRDGAQGIAPFSDDVSAAFRRAGWILQSRITVGKDPVIEMQKTNSHGLLYKNWRQKAEALRVGLPDYVLVFRKWPGNVETAPVTHDPQDLTYYGEIPPRGLLAIPSRKNGQINASLPVWQNYANPIWDDVQIPCVWQDINQMDVLNYQVAKGDKDERHICPLQLDLSSRLIHWYTNPGETVYDPFAGIGSTLYEAVKANRRGVGAELKPEYYRISQRYLRQADLLNEQPTLFDLLPASPVASEAV